MSADELALGLEAILLVSGDAAPYDRLRNALGCDDGALDEALSALAAQLDSRGIRLQRGRDGVSLVSAPEFAGPVERFLGIQAASRPSAASLETLAIVAMRQPVSRIQIEEIRGVNCERVLRSLAAQGLIEEVGRGTGLGRPVLYGTTEDFLHRFGLESVAMLPPIDVAVTTDLESTTS
ncbi:MAG TPA: SMC-Scp complex subunit ScpB [Chloroflexota bacterium]|nr:SMC-Scp complex subunit ScpB [Chloroflexota bacterium]